MRVDFNRDRIVRLGQESILLGDKERPEMIWLKGQFTKIRENYQLKTKEATDCFIYEKMYGRKSEKSSSYMKIRYWRTGRYMPENRERCLLLGRALELSEEETEYLIKNYFDRCMVVYDEKGEVQGEYECVTEVSYGQKRALMNELIQKYLEHTPMERMEFLKVNFKDPKSSLRHLYFVDAFQYICVPENINSNVLNRHITSIRYDSEWKRQIRLLGEIPRKTMLRHLILLNLPDLTLSEMNRQLKFLGYLPLCEEHTMAGGERLDWLLIRLIQLYEEISKKEDPEECVVWFQEACRTLDQIFQEENKPRMRFMHFKSLDVMDK